MKDTTRRLFLSGMAKMGAALPVAVSILPEQVQAVADAAPREGRLRKAFADLLEVVDTDFPEYECRAIEPPGDPAGTKTDNMFLVVAFLRDLAPPPPPVKEYDGPGVYEIALAGWEARYTQIRQLEAAPSGQFRFRWPKAKPHARWTYKDAAQFSMMRRVFQ